MFKEQLQEIYTNPAKLSDCYNKFHNYSFYNQCLAIQQLGNAEPIATYKRWAELGFQVQKGSKAIALYMPVTAKDKLDETKTKTFFIMRKNWFGLSATNAPKDFVLPDLQTPAFGLGKAIETLGINIIPFKQTNGNMQGYAKPQEKAIAVSPLAAIPVKTTLHEIAHCIMHNELETLHENFGRDIKELEAEAVAYFVCKTLNLCTDEQLASSRAYIQTWFNNFAAIQEKTAQRIFSAVDKILKAGKQS